MDVDDAGVEDAVDEGDTSYDVPHRSRRAAPGDAEADGGSEEKEEYAAVEGEEESEVLPYAALAHADAALEAAEEEAEEGGVAPACRVE